MLGLGSNITKAGKIGKPIVKDGLVLKHGYARGPVEPCSTGAAYFNDSANDYISIGNPANLNMGDGSFSVSCWARSLPEDGDTHADFVLSKTGGEATAAGGDEGYAFYLGNGRTDWVFWASDGTGAGKANTTDAITANQWYHLCGTFDGSRTVRLYVDGVLVDTGTAANSGGSAVDLGNIDVGNDFNIGRGSSDTRDFSGYICNVGVWKGVVLTQPQVKSIMHKDYASLSASEKTGLVSWWNLDSVIDSVGASTAVYDNHYAGGSELGSELVTNGTFDSNLTNWGTNGTDSNNTIVQANGKVVLTSDGSTALLLQQISVFEVGKIYKVQFDAYDITGAGFKIQSGDNENISAITADGSYTVYHKATGTNVNIFRRTGDSASAGKLDNISVKLVNGNHGTLA